ncbi:MAG: LLM class F420-dependent oxidoreductase [Acidimicrobiaceae bacterium]|nr:LLM class F420-dependent oxidoreductase [Acidimicrobiaceae bacterium]
MDWGVHLPHLGRQATRRNLIDFAQHAENLGYHSAWVSDHIAWPRAIESKYPYSEDGSFAASPDMPWLDPLGTMFFVAGCTERIRLGTTVLILGYRPAVLTAKAISSLDSVSEGRVILGVGVGWMREEFEILGMPFDHRGKRADELLQLFAELFSNDEPTWSGEYYNVPQIGFAPKPVNRGVPVWVGGDTEPAFRRAARFGDAFHAAFQPVAEVHAAWKRVCELAADAGRDPASLRLSVRLYLDPASSMPAATSIAGSKEQMLDTVGGWQAIGVDHILLDPVAPGGYAARRQAMETFMTDVAASVT